jgi:hypothetical protein
MKSQDDTVNSIYNAYKSNKPLYPPLLLYTYWLALSFHAYIACPGTSKLAAEPRSDPGVVLGVNLLFGIETCFRAGSRM